MASSAISPEVEAKTTVAESSQAATPKDNSGYSAESFSDAAGCFFDLESGSVIVATKGMCVNHILGEGKTVKAWPLCFQ